MSVDNCKARCLNEAGCDCIQMWFGQCYLRKNCVIGRCDSGNHRGTAYTLTSKTSGKNAQAAPPPSSAGNSAGCNKYTLSGFSNSWYNGVWSKQPQTCGGKPIYKKSSASRFLNRPGNRWQLSGSQCGGGYGGAYQGVVGGEWPTDQGFGGTWTCSEPTNNAPAAAATCSDVPPDNRYSCAQQASWGKCDVRAHPWMAGHCCQTCFQCNPQCGRGQEELQIAPAGGELQKLSDVDAAARHFDETRKTSKYAKAARECEGHLLDLAKPQITAVHQSVKAKLDEHVDDCAIDASQCDDAKEGGCETKEDEKRTYRITFCNDIQDSISAADPDSGLCATAQLCKLANLIGNNGAGYLACSARR